MPICLSVVSSFMFYQQQQPKEFEFQLSNGTSYVSGYAKRIRARTKISKKSKTKQNDRGFLTIKDKRFSTPYLRIIIMPSYSLLNSSPHEEYPAFCTNMGKSLMVLSDTTDESKVVLNFKHNLKMLMAVHKAP